MHRFESDCVNGSAEQRLLYDGWLNVDRSSMTAMDTFVTESTLAFPGGRIVMRQLGWSKPLESVCTTSQRCYMMNLSVSGSVTGGSFRNLRAIRREAEPLGRMWLVPPNQTFSFTSMQGQSRSILCLLDADLFAGFLARAPAWRENEDLLRSAFHINGGQLEWLLRRMYRELRHPDFATPQVIETLAKQLTVEIIRTLKLHREETAHYVGGLAPWRLRLIRKRLWSEESLPDIEELANLCDMTARHLSRAFRAETGRTIGEHIETAMVDRANRMLGSGTPVREVALTLGYATSGSFAAAFRRATGLLPSEVNAKGKTRGSARVREPQALHEVES